MKKILMTLAALALAGGTALAQRGDGPGQMRGNANPADCDMTGPGPMAGKAMRGPENRGANRGKRGGPVSKEMRAQMRAERDAIRDLVGAIRLETDDTQKAELTSQLRTKLGEVADRMQAHQEERLAQAEERFTALKERIESARANRDRLIEEEIQRLLSGERPKRPAAFDDFPYAKGGLRGKGQSEDRPGRGPHGFMPPPPPDEELADNPPPPDDDRPGDMPPPPEE